MHEPVRVGIAGRTSTSLRSHKRFGPVRAAHTLERRRALVAVLNVATIAALAAAMFSLLGHGGWSMTKAAMMVAFVITLPWLSIGFWNAIIGAVLLALKDRVRLSDPLALNCNDNAVIVTKTAIVMAVRNEDPSASLARIGAIYDEIVADGMIEHFDFHVLSDTDDARIAALEERGIARWRTLAPRPDKIFYRRRVDNAGYKAGNIAEFNDRTAGRYDFFVTLDADSFMSASAIARLVRMMQAYPRLGILQTLVVGTPSKSFFTRVFQFGMRQGMRSYTTGSVWWQGDCGPYWGHNAIIRARAFREHCKLPVLPGNGPLSGHIMSHDQVEAVLMRRGGYHVRVLAQEGESWEENPPTLPDFIRRELRWCQGNMQYFSLLGMKGLKAMSRLQLALAILMYVGAVGWMAFLALGTLEVLTGGIAEDYPAWQGAALFAIIISMSLMPKLMGLANILSSTRHSALYGGRGRVVAGGAIEIVFSMLLAPVVNFAVAVFALGLMFGKRVDWRAQEREQREVAWDEAAVTFLPQTLTGIGILALLAYSAPTVIPWAMPIIAGFALSMPFAVLTASRWAGDWSVRQGLCGIPEEKTEPVPLMAMLERARTQQSNGHDGLAEAAPSPGLAAAE